CVPRLSQRARDHPRQAAGRLAAYRRYPLPRPGRFLLFPQPRRRHVQLRRREHLSEGSREPAVRPPRRRQRGGGAGGARREGIRAGRHGDPAPGFRPDRRCLEGLLPRQGPGLFASALHRHGRGAAAQRRRQDRPRHRAGAAQRRLPRTPLRQREAIGRSVRWSQRGLSAPVFSRRMCGSEDRMSGCIRKTVLAAAALGALATSPVRAAEDAAHDFYQGRQIRFYTKGSPGGGYDAYMRALGPFLERKLGAKIVPTNEPGAGGLIAMNRTLNAPPDGLTVALIGGETLVTAQLYESPGVNYDVRMQTWLARVSSEAKVALLGPKSSHHSVADAMRSDQPIIWVGSGKIDGNADFSALLNHVLGLKSKIVVGYKGTGDMN